MSLGDGTHSRKASNWAVLTHPLIGRRPRRTAVGIGWLVTVLAGVFAVNRLPVWLLEDGDRRSLVNTLDGVVAVVILLVGISILAGIGYGLWNGGPVLATLVAALPVIVGTVASGDLVLDIDLVLALCGGAAAASLGAYATGVRVTGRLRPRPFPGAADTLGVAVFVTALGATALVRLRGQAGPHTEFGVTAATLFLFVALVTIGVVLSGCLRAGERTAETT